MKMQLLDCGELHNPGVGMRGDRVGMRGDQCGNEVIGVGIRGDQCVYKHFQACLKYQRHTLTKAVSNFKITLY